MSTFHSDAALEDFIQARCSCAGVPDRTTDSGWDGEQDTGTCSLQEFVKSQPQNEYTDTGLNKVHIKYFFLLCA